MANIDITFKAQVLGGPTISQPQRRISVEAYEQIQVELAPGEGKTVQIGTSDQFNLLIIWSDLYSDGSSEIKYTIGTLADIDLDQLQTYLGGSAEAILTESTITFQNDYAAPAEGEDPKTATIQLLIGRDATPPPAPPPGS
ncbi:MAG: hypothetical protein AAF572_01390 [Cyanobacteria bacterium P01_B01_bin.77]